MLRALLNEGAIAVYCTRGASDPGMLILRSKNLYVMQTPSVTGIALQNFACIWHYKSVSLEENMNRHSCTVAKQKRLITATLELLVNVLNSRIQDVQTAFLSCLVVPKHAKPACMGINAPRHTCK